MRRFSNTHQGLKIKSQAKQIIQVLKIIKVHANLIHSLPFFVINFKASQNSYALLYTPPTNKFIIIMAVFNINGIKQQCATCKKYSALAKKNIYVTPGFDLTYFNSKYEANFDKDNHKNCS